MEKRKYKLPTREEIESILMRRLEHQRKWQESLQKKYYEEQQVKADMVAEDCAVYETA